MPFKKVNKKDLEIELNDVLKNSKKARKSHEDFLQEIELKKSLINARNKENITQVELSNITGLSQQAISRLERGIENANVSTLLRYLKGIGHKLEIKKI